MWLEQACSGRHQNLVRLRELAGMQPIERAVKLNAQRFAKSSPLSHVGGRRRETRKAPA